MMGKGNKGLFALLAVFALASCGESSIIGSESISFGTSSISTSSIPSTSESTSEPTSEPSITSSSLSSEISIPSSFMEPSSSESIVDLGGKTIAEVIELINDDAIETNSFGIGVDVMRKVTITGLALSKFDLVNSTSKFGLDVSAPGKVLVGDSTGMIVVASKPGNQGTSFYGKVADYAGKETSKYKITGYLSKYLGKPEVFVPDTSYVWNQNLDVSCDVEGLSKGVYDLDGFTSNAKAINYNCAGHGYGDVITMRGMRCYSFDAGSGVYFFTDGKGMMKAVKGVVSCAVGQTYDLTGLVTTKDWKPALRLLRASVSSSPTSTPDLSMAVEMGSVALRAKKSSQDDTSSRFDEFIGLFQNVYKAEVFMDYTIENSKAYVGFSDASLSNITLTGKTNAMANHGLILIDNDNFWNVTEDEINLFNPYGYNGLLKNPNEKVTVYYVPTQLDYSKGKTMWKVLLLNECMPEIVK